MSWSGAKQINRTSSVHPINSDAEEDEQDLHILLSVAKAKVDSFVFI